YVQDLETESGHRKEIDRDQLLEVIVQEGAPGLRGRLAAAHHVLAHAALPDVEAEFDQLPVDAWCTPTGMFPAHPAAQVSNRAGHERPSGLAPVPPSRSRTSQSRHDARQRRFPA